ncbi:MAG: hypothetical protein GY771_01035, partial [bacterium]|nr:hypothetical protein [bacterium]
MTTYNRYIYIEEESKPGTLQVLRFQPDETPPKIALDRDSLYFSAVTAGVKSRSQLVRVDNEGGGTLQLSVSKDATWFNYDIVNGSNIRIGMGNYVPAAGSYTGTLTVTNTQSFFDVKTVTVYLQVYDPSETT